jgi:alcohol dehydrogenase (nicotinoprotein)
MKFTEEQIQRYSRQMILPGFGGKGQRKLAAARVFIMGVGGLGSPAETQLTIPLYEIPLMEKSILGCNYGSGDARVDLITLLELYKSGRINLEKLVTNRYSIEEINTGFRDLEAGKTPGERLFIKRQPSGLRL